jgi:hypothetical protein
LFLRKALWALFQKNTECGQRKITVLSNDFEFPLNVDLVMEVDVDFEVDLVHFSDPLLAQNGNK